MASECRHSPGLEELPPTHTLISGPASIKPKPSSHYTGGTPSSELPAAQPPSGPPHLRQFSLPLYSQSLHCFAIKTIVSCCDNEMLLEPFSELLIWGSNSE